MKFDKPVFNTLRVRVCGVLVQNDAILLVRHKGIGELGELWIPPGGGMEYGHNIDENIQREVLEETGLRVEVNKFICGHEHLESPLHAIELFFEVVLLDGELILGKDPELEEDSQMIDKVAFVTFEELKIMDDRVKHEILKGVNSYEDLLQCRGDFMKRNK